MKTHVYRMGELFCGPGGLALGASMAAAHSSDGTELVIRHAWATDYDPDACATYSSNIPHATRDSVICADIRSLDMHLLAKISPIDGLAFGFPCNDFSVVGEHKGLDGQYGPLYTYGITALRYFKPQWFVAENVGGIRSANAGRALARILEDLYACGYSVYPHLYSFDKYGVPQRRQRVIIVGIRRDLKGVVFRVPSPELFANIDVSAQAALETPPIPPDAPNHQLTRQDQRVVQRLKLLAPGQNAFQAVLPTELALRVRGARISQIYRRLHPDRPAYTVTGSGGGGTHMYHWNEPRALTNRERARLQTFPDNFVFVGGKESVRRQIGMAVPCIAAKHVFNAVLNSLARVRYPSVSCSIPPLIQPEHADSNNFNCNSDTLHMFHPQPSYGRSISP